MVELKEPLCLLPCHSFAAADVVVDASSSPGTVGKNILLLSPKYQEWQSLRGCWHSLSVFYSSGATNKNGTNKRESKCE